MVRGKLWVNRCGDEASVGLCNHSFVKYQGFVKVKVTQLS